MGNLVTGTRGGLGKYLAERFPGAVFHRQSDISPWLEGKIPPPDAIIHCAFNSDFNAPMHQLVEDNLLLTHKLLKIPTRKFVYISSVDVYPKSLGGPVNENAAIPPRDLRSTYGYMKYEAESMVRASPRPFLILRPASLLGPYGKESSLSKIVHSKERVTLASNSELNCVTYEEVSTFISRALEQDLTGVFNITSRNNVSLKAVAEHYGSRTQFGGFEYSAGDIDNEKAAAVVPSLADSSLSKILAHYPMKH